MGKRLGDAMSLRDWFRRSPVNAAVPTVRISADEDIESGNVEKASPSVALGVTGLNRWGDRGVVGEEFLRELSGRKAYKVYREMRDNDPVVGAVLFAIRMVIRNVKWRVEGGDEDMHEFVESCMYDMSQSWANTMSEILTMLPFGWSLFEVTYKRRRGESRNVLASSKHKDGKIGWKAWGLRGQDTLDSWVWDEEGTIASMVQSAPPRTRAVEIPMDRCLLFRVDTEKNNPEGRSILRNAYEPWYYAKHLQRIEAIGHERDLAGLPVIEATKGAYDAYGAVLKKILTSIKRDEQEGVLIPQAYDDKGNPAVKLSLLSAAGSRQLNIGETITRYQRLIAITVMADFVMMGHEKVGSLALASSKTSMFSLAVGAILQQIAGEINDREIPRLLRYNGMSTDDPPRLVPGDIETPDPKELAMLITAMSGAGVLSTPDDDLENHLRAVMGLPEKSEDAMPTLRTATPPAETDVEEPEPADDAEDSLEE